MSPGCQTAPFLRGQNTAGDCGETTGALFMLAARKLTREIHQLHHANCFLFKVITIFVPSQATRNKRCCYLKKEKEKEKGSHRKMSRRHTVECRSVELQTGWLAGGQSQEVSLSPALAYLVHYHAMANLK